MFARANDIDVQWGTRLLSPIEDIEREARLLRSMSQPESLPVGRRVAHALYDARCSVDLRRFPRLRDALWKVAANA